MLPSLSRAFAALLVLIALPVMAEVDPPARVGRLAHIENEVNFRVDRNDQGGAATINWPISSGAVLETGRQGRAEAWIGSTAYRLADDSQVEFAVVDDTRVWVRINGGSLAVSILDRDQADDIVIATPDGDVRFQAPGRYRIDVDGERSALTVHAGRAIFEERGKILPVAAGQIGARWSDGRERLDTDWNTDAFDRWVSSRENATLAGPARRYVSPQMTGYADLDAYGDWQSAADYGTVWYPRGLAADWAPYRFGRWAWVAPWGWTWIDAAPWGFAPFHYGRWAIIGGRWAWVPGRMGPRPVYAPALVAWVGNPGWSVSFSFGAAPAVGWFPLAPREVYVPVHRHSPNYIRQINVTHVHDVHFIDRAARPDYRPHHAFRQLPRAVTVVPTQTLREGRPISRDDYRPPERRELDKAPAVHKAPSADWLPPPRAQRPFDDERRNGSDRLPRDRDGRRAMEAGERSPNALPREAGRPMEEGRRDGFRRGSEAPRPAVAPMQPEPASRLEMPRREPAQPATNAGRMRDGDRNERDQRGFEANGRRAQPGAGESAPPAGGDAPRQFNDERRRGEMRRPPEAVPGAEAPVRQLETPPVRREVVAPETRRDERPGVESDPRRGVREMPRFERQPESVQPVPQAVPQRETPRPAPEWRREERHTAPSIQPMEREQRREMREMQRAMPEARMPESQPAAPVQRFERPQPAPQREMPRATPEVRMAAPQPPAPRMEAPRPGPSFDGGDRHRRRDDERGPR